MVQAASAFANRLLPAGLGGLTLNVQYLRKSGHNLAQALTVAGANNTLGAVGHMVLMLIVIIASRGQLFDRLHVPHASALWVLAAILAGVIILNIVVFSRLRAYLYNLTGEVVSSLLAYRKRPGDLLLALACSLVLTSCYVSVLYLSCQAVDAHLSLWNMFAVFTVGIAAATVTPTPGGLGGAEAGLVAALVAYGVDASTALAATLLYRLLTYWVPLLPGFAFFVAIRRRLV
jgi:undecaprenyl-diphosphatase